MERRWLVSASVGRTHQALGLPSEEIAEQMKPKPLLVANLVECAADGSYGAFQIRRTLRLRVFSDRLSVANVDVPFSRLLDVAASDDMIGFAYVEAAGKRKERHFRCETFWPGGGRKEVTRICAQLDAVRPAPPQPSASGTTASRAQALDSRTVTVRAPSVAFPPRCPTCFAPGRQPARLVVSSALASGEWLVPTCSEHASVSTAITVRGWSRRTAELTFVFSRPDYASEFLRLNCSEQPVVPDPSSLGDAMSEVRSGTRFVRFSFTVSAIVLSVRRPSDIIAVGGGQNAVVRGIPYSIISLACGWWGFPHGPIFTIGSLVTNFRGGHDLTPYFVAVLKGHRHPAVA
jgi:hypothetical protein